MPPRARAPEGPWRSGLHRPCLRSSGGAGGDSAKGEAIQITLTSHPGAVLQRRPAVTVRCAARGDIPAIAAVDASAVTDEEVVGFGTPRSERTFADPLRLAAAWKEPNRVGGEEGLVAELDGRIAAYATLEDRGPCLELVNIAVAREHRRHGIGTQVVASVEDRARRQGREAVTLGTSRNAHGVPWASFPWWLRLGYHVTGEEENAWTRRIGPGTREIRMRKDLRPLGRVTLRDVTEEDVPLLFQIQRDPVANRMAAFTAKDPDDWVAFHKHWDDVLADEHVRMKTVVLDGRVVGNAGSFVDPEFGKTEVTCWIGREWWGRGIATLALTELLRRVPERPVYARAAEDNVASIRALEKCGFVLVDRSRGFAQARGEETAEVILRLGELDPPKS